jgi:hypothetical protein
MTPDGAKHQRPHTPLCMQVLTTTPHPLLALAQVKMDGAKRQLANAERNTQAEHARLQQVSDCV